MQSKPSDAPKMVSSSRRRLPRLPSRPRWRPRRSDRAKERPSQRTTEPKSDRARRRCAANTEEPNLSFYVWSVTFSVACVSSYKESHTYPGLEQLLSQCVQLVACLRESVLDVFKASVRRRTLCTRHAVVTTPILRPRFSKNNKPLLEKKISPTRQARVEPLAIAALAIAALAGRRFRARQCNAPSR